MENSSAVEQPQPLLRSVMNLFAVALMSFAVVIGGFSPATADRHTATDREDDYTWLDIKAVRHRHKNRQLVHTVHTYRPWDPRDLDNQSYIRLRFDTDGGPRPEHWITIDVDDGGRLFALMRDRRSGEVVQVPVWRPDSRSAAVRFDRPLLSRHSLQEYRWKAVTRAQYCEEPESDSTPIVLTPGRCWDYSGKYISHRL